MRLSEILAYTDLSRLRKLADHYALDCSRHSKNELIQNTMLRLTCKRSISHDLQKLSLTHLRYLQMILFDAHLVFSEEELAAKAHISVINDSKIHGESEQVQIEPEDIVKQLHLLGWIHPCMEKKDRGLFRLPSDLRELLISLLWNDIREQMHLGNVPVAYRDEKKFIYEDVALFMHMLTQGTWHIGGDGTLYKRDLQQLLSQLHIPEDTQMQEIWRFGYGRHFKHYPDRFSLIYDFCYYRRWIEEGNECLLLSQEGELALQQWRQTKGNPDPIEFVAFWLRLYKRAIPSLHTLVYWLARSGEQWVKLSSIEKLMIPWIRPFYYDRPTSILRQRVIRMMMHMGLLCIGEAQDGQELICMTRFGQQYALKSMGLSEDTIILDGDRPDRWNRIEVKQANNITERQIDNPQLTW